MRIDDLFGWLRRPSDTGRSPSEQKRFDDAERTRKATQSHYRSVTGTDSQGRTTDAGDGGKPPRQG